MAHTQDPKLAIFIITLNLNTKGTRLRKTNESLMAWNGMIQADDD